MEGKLCQCHEEDVKVTEVEDDDDLTSELSYETVYHTPVDLLISLQGSPGAKVENGGFECWTSFAVECAQLPV